MINKKECPFTLEQKNILVSGGSSGIGKATSILCALLGAQVSIVGRDIDRLNDTLSGMEGQGHKNYSMDLTNEENIKELVEYLPNLDGAVFCAGKGLTLPVQFCSRKQFNDIFEINFFSTVELIRTLYKKKKLNRNASLVLLASMGGTQIYSGGNSIYGTSKAALNSFMKFAAKEFSTRGIRVNSVCPGMVDTPFIHRGTISEEQLKEDAKRYPLKRYGTPNDIANAIVFLLSDASSWITGTSLTIDGGLSLV